MENRIPDAPPRFVPIAEQLIRPMWSVMIPVYNCGAFLASAIQSVLVQDPGCDHMQIEVIDDASTDCDVEALVKCVGGNRVGYSRQPSNAGSLRNFQTCIERSKGKLIHILHGDDRVRNGFYSRMERLFFANPGMGAAFCRYAYIDESGRVMYNHEREADEEGILTDCLMRLCVRQRMQYVSTVVRRSVYERVGGFYGVEYGEDWEMWARIAARYPIGYIPDVLAEYRKHLSSVSGRSFLTGENMKSLRWVMNNLSVYLPEEKRKNIQDQSRKFYAHYGLRVANSIWSNLRHKRGAHAQVKAAWNMWPDARLALKIMKLYTRMTLNI